MCKFLLGNIVTTSGVSDKIKSDNKFSNFCHQSLIRHSNCDWGDLEEEDLDCNDEALEQNDRLLSSYNLPPDLSNIDNENIFIITEYDRSVTTILFPSEY